MKKVKIQGHFTVIFNRLETARLLNVAVNTLKRWEALGIVPPSNFVDSKGRTVYTVGQLQLLKAVMRKHRTKENINRNLPADQIRSYLIDHNYSSAI